MQPITLRADLIKRMTMLFSSVAVPGLRGQIRDLSYEDAMVLLDFEVDALLANQYRFRARWHRRDDA
jgi:hypothetical protein